MEPTTIIDKLRILLPHWITHNRNHEAEFGKWAALARTEGAENLATLLDKAAAAMVATDTILKQVGQAVGAPGEIQGHAHRHDHEPGTASPDHGHAG
ncbi:MAG: hypothetical protein A2498_09870 [Lentisphaerae bacterium RIFOXYC12_FULL_60_16]|nr:MAG: hypothetical protein A2498_09870 [Lentisphaerae bacterium RIFOXYC12_FULL_60_16]